VDKGQKLNRRYFLRFWAVMFMLVTWVLGSCGPTAQQPAAATPAPGAATAAPGGAIAPGAATAAPAAPIAASNLKEAPALAEQVKAGTLPSVDKRLPDAPVVTTPVEAVGKYGGTLQTASWWPEVGNVQLYFAVEAPIKWKADLTGYEPGLAESYEWSQDGKIFTLHLRKGMKWSDGQPYTTADWKYWWEDFAQNSDQKIWTIPAYLRNDDGTPIDMTFPDEYTVVWTSKDRPLWIDPYFMAQGFWEFAKNFMKPAHYLKQYHPKYASGKTWEDYTTIDKWWQTPGYPCLFAWCLTELSSDGKVYTFGRNPYYWRVDTEGNQLPYIDAIRVEIVEDEQTRILNCQQGKYDTAFRICGSPNEIPLLDQNAKNGGYHFLKNYMNGAGAWPGYMVNQDYVEGGKNYADDTPEHAKEIRDILRDARFRQALSMGFDRKRVIDVAWGGIAEPKGVTISPQSWHFTGTEGQAEYKKWAESFITFDAAKANALLDEIGMKKGAGGMRTLPSGKDFTLVIDVSDWGGSLKVQVDAADEMKKQWGTNLGINVSVNNLQGQPDLDTRTNEGYYMVRGAHISEIDILTYPDWIFPVVNRYYFPLEGRWFAKGGAKCTDKPTDTSKYPCGLEPEAGSPAKILQDLYVKARTTPTIEERHKVVWEAIDEHVKSGPFVISVAGDQPMPIIVKDYMRNIMDFGVVGPWAPATPGNQVVAQWWMDK
jgi:peptide/nickel transport system substrate-binding protein